MIINRVIVGELRENCYILEDNNDVIVIDPGDEYIKIKPYIENKNILAVLVTHHHFDHVGALNYFDKNKIYDIHNLEEKEYKFNNFKFEVIYTKGHKEDAITFYFKNESVMFTGDFIFRDSIGRTDLPGGNMKEMLDSLDKISNYSDNITIYPGHGPKTNLGYEKNNFKFYY